MEELKSGNVEKVRQNIELMYPKYPAVLDSLEQKNEEYMAVIAVYSAVNIPIVVFVLPGVHGLLPNRVINAILKKYSGQDIADKQG